MEQDIGSGQDMQKLLEIARSPDGQKLLSMVQQHGGKQFGDAMQQAEGGDYTQVKEMLEKMMDSAEAQALIQRIQRCHE